MTQVIELPRSKRLKAGTETTHDSLDRTIMGHEPFRDRGRYARFLTVQYAFHRDLDALYDVPALAALIPDLVERRRIDLIGQDLAELETALPTLDAALAFDGGGPVDIPTALGWLYVAEGANLGAAFLYKAAAGLGLDAAFGARHLAGHPDGRARHWRGFTEALDAVAFDDAEDARLIAGARSAFERVHGLVDRAYR